VSYQLAEEQRETSPERTSTSYTTPATTTADSGSTFVVVVSNTAGTVTSSAGTADGERGSGGASDHYAASKSDSDGGTDASFTTAAKRTAPLNISGRRTA